MKKMIPLIFLSLFLGACNKNGESCPNSSELDSSTEAACTVDQPIVGGPEIPGPVDPPVKPVDPPPTSAYTFDVNILFINTTSSQQAKFDQAVEMIKRVIASEEFKNAVIGHTYNGSKTYVDNGGFSNTQIYQKMLDGAEKLSPAKNNAMDMEVELYYASNSTVGYTYANSKRVWVNTKFFNTNTVSGVAANLVHEWLHKLGFGHSSSYNAARDYSVPYSIGRMVKSIGPKL